MQALKGPLDGAAGTDVHQMDTECVLDTVEPNDDARFPDSSPSGGSRKQMIEIDESLAVACQTADGFSCTLPSHLGMLLVKAEHLFGPRNPAFTILGVEFKQGVPQIWFPHNRGHVIVQLSVEAMQDPTRALFQLAHECIHLLDPADGGTNNLEEGIATLFQLECIKSIRADYSTGDVKYDAACSAVEQMLALQPNAARKLREIYGPWRHAKQFQISDVCPEITADLARFLSSPF